ncbi:MAG TPA: response regulator [Candidatus Acidoferrales bacterium]|nr:response regulator [Candidatus Acidoferrales bacterium]
MKPSGAAAQSGQSPIERRRRRRAKISAQVHVRVINGAENFDEVCMSVDVSRDGLLFHSKRPGYWKGQQVEVIFPYSTEAAALNTAQLADIVRVSDVPAGKHAIAVQFQTAKHEAKMDHKGPGHAFDAGAVGGTAAQGPQSMVLAVESDTRTAEIMRNVLQQDGYTVVIVPTAQEALEILRTTIPAAFIAEVEAGDMSGHDLCLIIKRNDRLQTVPVILLTRGAHPADYSASHQLGAVVCMAKPFQPERLLHVVRLVAPPPSMKSAYGASRMSNGNIERSF